MIKNFVFGGNYFVRGEFVLYINHSGKYIEINFNMKIPFLVWSLESSTLYCAIQARTPSSMQPTHPAWSLRCTHFSFHPCWLDLPGHLLACSPPHQPAQLKLAHLFVQPGLRHLIGQCSPPPQPFQMTAKASSALVTPV